MSEDSSQTMLTRFELAVQSVESNAVNAVTELSKLQHEVARNSLFSFQGGTETIDDIATSSLPFLLLEHHLAMAYLNVPTSLEEIQIRLKNLKLSVDLWNVFFKNMESLELLSKDEMDQYKKLIEISDAETEQGNFVPPPVSRDVKIARFKAMKQAESESKRLEGLMQRRQRLGITETDQLDGHDEEGLARTLALTKLDIAKSQALEEWSSTLRELPMIARMASQPSAPRPSPPPPKKGGLQVTHVTQDPSGQLQFRREQIQSNVFKPSWNQPTMTLQELGDIEYKAAMERSKRQEAAEASNQGPPKKYADLVKAGLEDDAELVDASAEADRKWDEFKDANPRGSGNKRGDVGDRNF